MAKRLTRAEVPVDQTWNLSDLFPNAEAWEAEIAALQAELPTVLQYKGRLGEGAGTLVACLEAYEAFYKRMMLVFTYASLRNSEDGTNPANQAAMGKVASLGAQTGAALSFVQTEPLQLPDGTLERYLQEEPKLEPFKGMIEELLEKKPHTLSPETEVALASLGEVLGAPSMTYNRAKSSDMTFEPITDENGNQVPVSFATYETTLETVEDTATRRQAWNSFTKGLVAYKNTFAATFATEVKKHVVMAKLRGYKSATHMLLQPQKVSVEMYNSVHDTILPELAPHMQRYARLRKRVLGLDQMLYPDIEAPLDPSFNPPISQEEVKTLIIDALSVLGPEYSKIMRTALNERWIDWADNVGKSTGAFCSSPYSAHSFILITWMGTMRNAFVLAHELGHSGHFTLAQRNQRMVNTRPSMFFVEAPSTINELLLAQHIKKSSNDVRLHRWVNMSLLATYHHNFVRHLLEGELQRRIFALAEQGRPITEKTLSETKGQILTDFWGDTVVVDEGAKLTWMRQPHYYMGLYPYTYSAGLTCGTAVAEAIAQEGQPAVDRWLSALKAGGTLKPLELTRLAGVDMSTPEPFKKAVAFVGRLVDEVEKTF